MNEINWLGIFMGILGLGLAVSLVIHTIGKNDKQNNSRWDECQIKYEQSGIPHEGRENFMRGCFEK